MKVLIYSHAFAPRVGGTETIVELLARGLAQKGAERSGDSVELTLVTPVPSAEATNADFPFRVIRQPSLVSLFRQLRRSDTIHLAGPAFVPMALGRLLRKPVVIEHHGFQAICPNGQYLYEPAQVSCPGHFMASRYLECIRCNASQGKLRSLKMWLLTFPRRWLCQRASANILPTEWLGGLLQLRHSVTVPHGLPPAKPRPAAPVAPAVPTFVFLGRLVSSKGVRVLLEASEQLKAAGQSFRVKIIGQGPDREQLERLAADLQIVDCIQFLGYLPACELEKALADASALVVPSLAGEVFGLVVLENMFRGKLSIVSEIGSLREVIGDAGLTFPPGDAAALASCMRQVLDKPSLVASMGAAARERAMQRFGLDSMIQRHTAIYRKVFLRPSH